MRRHPTNWFSCFVLIAFLLPTQGCMIAGAGHGGGGGGGLGIPGATLISLSPSSVTAGGPPFTLTITGAGFVAGGSITFNNAFGISYTLVSSTEVTVLIDAGMIATPISYSLVAHIPTPRTNPSNALTLTITPFTSSTCILYGLNRFLFTGFDSTGPVTVAGMIGVDSNGNISGEEDFKSSTVTRVAEPITDGSCTNSATPNEGTLSVTTAAGTSNYTFVLQQAPNQSPRGRFAESGDANGISGSGRFVETPPDGFFSGDYVFGMVGQDGSGGRMSVVGRFTDNDNNMSTAPGTLSAGDGDINDAGALAPSVQITGTVSVPDSFTRCTTALTLGNQVLNLAIYVNSSGGGFVMDIDTGAQTPILAGLISSQAFAGQLSNANAFTDPVVFGLWGVVPGSPAASDTSVGLASNFNSGARTFDLVFDQVAAGTANLNQTVTGASYDVAGNGRTTVSYTLGGNTSNFIFYVDGQGGGYMQQTSGTSVGFGLLESQVPGPYDNSAISATFAGGTFLPPLNTSPNTAAEITLNNGSISGGTLTGTFNVAASGRGTAAVNLPAFGSNNLVFYVIGPGAIEVMGSDSVTANTIGFLNF
jgi:hypothetical protein